MEITQLLEERGSRYGEFEQHARITQAIKYGMGSEAPEDYFALPPYMKEGLEMIAHKIGRIINGDPYYLDSWDDIQGYAKLVSDQIRKERNGD